jgi:hypothetical protein
MGHSTFSSLAGLSLDALVQQGVFFLNFSLEGGGQGCLRLRASNEHILIVRVPRARKAPGRSPSHPSKCPFKELLRGGHVLLDIALQLPRSCFPVVGHVADMAGGEDELISSVRRSTKSFVLPRMNRSTG